MPTEWTPESSEEREQRRIAKFRRNQEHFRYLIEHGMDPLTIADQLTHNMLESMRIGLETKFPEATPAQIREKMKELIEQNRKLKAQRRTRQHVRD